MSNNRNKNNKYILNNKTLTSITILPNGLPSADTSKYTLGILSAEVAAAAEVENAIVDADNAAPVPKSFINGERNMMNQVKL